MQKAWKAVIGVLATLLILLLVAEAGIRMYLANQITEGFAQEQSVSAPQEPGGADTSGGAGTSGGAQPAKPEVFFGSQPVTLGLLGGALPHLMVNSPSTLAINGDTVTGNPAAYVELDKVRLTQGEAVAESFHLTTELPNDYLRAVLNTQLRSQFSDNRFLSNLVAVSEVVTNPSDGTFTVKFTSGAAGVELRPVTEGGQLTFQAASTQLFGIDLPSGVADAVTNAIAEGMQDQVTRNARVTDVSVIPGGLRVELTGENVNLAELQGTYQP